MALNPILQSFYASDKWINFRNTIILERGPNCEECGKLIIKHKQIEVHHIIPLTVANVNDVFISLNPDNVKVLCNSCHNKKHNRFFGAPKKKQKVVYLVYGSPCSGKTSYVMQHKSDNDIVVDMDRLYEAITLLPRYYKPNKLLGNVMRVKNLMLDDIKTRYGKWETAWIIGGYADKYKREKLIRDIAAEPILISASKEECLKRLLSLHDRNKNEWKKYIEEWFARYKA